jgi:sugar phosphate isomerase/epimerase
MNKVNAQLWSVRDYTEKDFFGTLEKLSKMGYIGVEFAGYSDISAKDMKNKLDELQLKGLSAHIGIDLLKNNLEKEIEYLNTLGAKYIVCPAAEIKTVDSAMEYSELFNKIGEKCFENGLIFGYHNHAFEFELDNGKYPLEVLFENVNPKFVKQQPDLYWVAYAGLDPIEYITKNANRCPIIHLKQIENMETKTNVDAASGIIDFQKVMKIAPKSDLVYEQEHYIGTSMEDMEKSIKFFKGEQV